MRIFLIIFIILSFLGCNPAPKAEKPTFRVAWSIYAGWMPWGYAAEAGIVKKWAAQYDINIEVVQINDYIESINQYTAGAFDACVMTNMDALTIPAATGVDSTALIIGDFSNGNDGIILKNRSNLQEINDLSVNLVEYSVSHYLLARALDQVGLNERAVTLVNTSDADMVSLFSSNDVQAVVTWNPQLGEIAAMAGANKVFDSSQIPGEILDLLVVNSATLSKHPELGKALVGAWFETLAVMAGNDAAALAAKTAMAEAAGTDLAGYEAQLATTKMFYQPAEAVAFANSPDLVTTMDLVRKFSFEHNLLASAKSVDDIGIAFPNQQVLGDPDNIKLRFRSDFMAEAP